MPAPAPYEFVSGRLSIDGQAGQIYGNYGWLYRWSSEIGADTDLDLKKLAQLAVHCKLYRAALDPFVPLAKQETPIVVALQDYFSAKGIKWADVDTMTADLTALYDGAGTLFDFLDQNLPAPRVFAERTYDANWQEVEQAVKVPKAQAFIDAVAALRALFGDDPGAIALKV